MIKGIRENINNSKFRAITTHRKHNFHTTWGILENRLQDVLILCSQETKDFPRFRVLLIISISISPVQPQTDIAIEESRLAFFW